MPLIILLCVMLFTAPVLSVQKAEKETTAYPTVLPMKDRVQLRDQWLTKRLDTIIPALMRDRGVDMWVLIAREYNEDPVVKTMLPATWLSARRRTVLIFHDTGNGVERFAVSRYAVGENFKAAWDPEEEPDQGKRVADIIQTRNPKRIALNISNDYALADGLSYGQYLWFSTAIGSEFSGRIVADHHLTIGWLERRIPEEMAYYPQIVGLAHAIIHEGFSNKVIIPGKTTTEDVVWWFRDKIRSMGVTAWFHPTVSIQRQRSTDQGHAAQFENKAANVIRRGDLLHVDFGITYLGLNTDTQHHAYVLKKGEADAPDGIKRAFKQANQLQDILTAEFKVGISGNDLLKVSRQKALDQGLEPSIYTHPIGFHGHGAGATIGLWDQQGGVKGRGDYPVTAHTAWSIELSNQASIPEWNGQKIRIMLEEDAYFNGLKVRYLDGRQTHLQLIQ